MFPLPRLFSCSLNLIINHCSALNNHALKAIFENRSVGKFCPGGYCYPYTNTSASCPLTTSIKRLACRCFRRLHHPDDGYHLWFCNQPDQLPFSKKSSRAKEDPSNMMSTRPRVYRVRQAGAEPEALGRKIDARAFSSKWNRVSRKGEVTATWRPSLNHHDKLIQRLFGDESNVVSKTKTKR